VDSVITRADQAGRTGAPVQFLGTVNPRSRHRREGAQSSARLWCWTPASRCRTCPFEWVESGADFVAFSGHKMLGPRPVLVCCGAGTTCSPDAAVPDRRLDDRGRTAWRAALFAAPPQRLRPGTEHRPGESDSGARSTNLTEVGMANVAEHEKLLHGVRTGRDRVAAGVRVIGPTTNEARGGAVSFVVDGIHPHDVGRCWTTRGSRSGRASLRLADRPPLQNIPATTRATFYLYNSTEDIDALVGGIESAQRFFKSMKMESLYSGNHPGPLQAPAWAGLKDPCSGEAQPRQPDVRRQLTYGCSCPRTARWCRSCRTRARGARSARPRLRCCTIWFAGQPVTDAIAVGPMSSSA